jgi:phage shock protein A
MGILGRINKVVKGNLNELIDKMSDPAKEVDLLIFEMREGLREAKAEVVTASAEAKRAERRVLELEEEVERWQQRAEQAVRLGDDDLARRALQQKAVVQRDHGEARTAQLAQWSYVEELKQSLKELDKRLEDAQRRKETIKQRARAAREGEGTGLAGGRAFADFERLEARIAGAEEAADVIEQSEGRSAAALDAEFSKLERENPPVDDELAELKRRMKQE